ncbi:hypothetical protein COB55_03920 [Candidatus Wolfebacteria bacterium]|nr:MAG: hypothetical protein COB55_03920 [Candidatus Wolfebacteria bacterium]
MMQLGIKPVDPVVVDQYKADMVKGKFVGFFEFRVHSRMKILLEWFTVGSLLLTIVNVGNMYLFFTYGALLFFSIGVWVVPFSRTVLSFKNSEFEYGEGAWTQEGLHMQTILGNDDAFDLPAAVVNRIRRIHEVYPHFRVQLEKFQRDPILRLIDIRNIPTTDIPDSFVIAMWDCPGFDPEKHRVSVSGV